MSSGEVERILDIEAPDDRPSVAFADPGIVPPPPSTGCAGAGGNFAPSRAGRPAGAGGYAASWARPRKPAHPPARRPGNPMSGAGR